MSALRIRRLRSQDAQLIPIVDTVNELFDSVIDLYNRVNAQLERELIEHREAHRQRRDS